MARLKINSKPTGSVIADVVVERLRQLGKWPREHDACHCRGELCVRAAELALAGTDEFLYPAPHLGGVDAWGLCAKHKGDRRKQLVVAAALLVAEIERLDQEDDDGEA